MMSFFVSHVYSLKVIETVLANCICLDVWGSAFKKVGVVMVDDFCLSWA